MCMYMCEERKREKEKTKSKQEPKKRPSYNIIDHAVMQTWLVRVLIIIIINNNKLIVAAPMRSRRGTGTQLIDGFG